MDTPYSTCPNGYNTVQYNSVLQMDTPYSTCNDYSITQSSKWIHLTVHVMITV